MRVNERMKKWISMALCLCMLVQNAPVMAFAATTDNLCEHHAEHTADCGYVEAVAGSDCTHVHDEACGYVAPVAGADCTHVHDDICGYVEAVEGSECTYSCEESHEEEPSEEPSEEPAPVCTCGTDSTTHATTCAVYVAPEKPECKCVEKCTEPNLWCDICGFDVTACEGGADEGVPYADGITVTIDTGISVTLQDADSNGYYDIGTADELYAFAAAVNGGNYFINGELTANITVNENVLGENGELNGDGSNFRVWTPIGAGGDPYGGTFDGNGHTVSGLYFNDPAANRAGLFSYIYSGTILNEEYNGTVQNVGVVDSYLSGDDGIGGVVGYNSAGTITGCYNTAAVSGTNYVGGVVGENYEGTITGCYNTAAVRGTGYYVGGVVGESDEGTITGCYNTAAVSGTDYVGGVVGESDEGTITGCYNTAAVTGTGYRVGGVVGENEEKSTITNCYNTGTVTGSSYYTGGVAGENSGTVTNCYNTGTVTGSRYYTGGVAGENSGTVTNCYYLTGTATGGIDGADEENQAEVKTQEQFASGEVAYILGNQFPNVISWGQTIGTDASPVLGGPKVYYGYAECGADAQLVYTNNAYATENPGHGGTATCTEPAVCPKCGETYGEPADHIGGSYSAEGDGIIDKCAGCGEIIMGTVTLIAEGKTYDGTAFAAAVTKDGTLADTEFTVAYCCEGGCIKAGKHTASITMGELTATADFTIEKRELKLKLTDCYKEYDGTNSLTRYTVELENFIFYDEGDYIMKDYLDYDDVYDDVDVDPEKLTVTLSDCVPDAYTTATVSGITLIGETAGNYTLAETLENVPISNDWGNLFEIGKATVTITSWNQNVELGADLDQTAYTVEGLPQGHEIKGVLLEKDGNRIAVNPNSIVIVNAKGERVEEYFDISCYNEGIFTEVCPGHSFDENGFCATGQCQIYEAPEVKDNGTEDEYDDYYAISNAGQLFWFADYVNNEYNDVRGKLMNDITVPEGKTWEPIMDFYGTFDGNFKTVSGLNASGETNVGMFGGGGYARGTIKNLGLTNSHFEGTSNVGGIAGYHEGTIENCYVDGSVTVVGSSMTGMLVGNNAGTVRNCYAYGSSLVGRFNDSYGSIENCYFLSDTEDSFDGTTAMTAAQFASGEVAWLLQNGIEPGGYWDENDEWVETEAPHVWGQTCGVGLPAFGGAKVYRIQSGPCPAGFGYANDENAQVTVPHDFTDNNGFCVCGNAYQEAVLNGDTYEISNAGQLYWFAALVNGGEYSANAILTDDIVVNENVLDEDGNLNGDGTGLRVWMPIGTDYYPYGGTFDGNGHTVSGLYFNDPAVAFVGLFSYIYSGTLSNEEYNGTVQNVGVVDSYLSGNYAIGGVVGYNAYGTIKNCYNAATVSGTQRVGGVVGDNTAGTITGCHNTGMVTGTGSDVGGVVGDNSGPITGCHNTGAVSGTRYVGGVVGYNNSTITGCHNTGAVSGTNYVGGVVGENYEGTITGCYNTAAVSGTDSVGGVAGCNCGLITECHNTAAVSGTNSVGGVVGENDEGTITGCYNTAAVTGTGYYVGGVVGHNEGSIKECYNTAAVSGTDSVGGVVGNNSINGKVTNCYNSGTVDGTSYVGGVVGHNDGSITNCYNSGIVDGNLYVGGVVGINNNNGSITNCYNSGAVNGSRVVGGVVGRTSGTVTNCYYLTGTANGGIDGKDAAGAEAKTTDQFASGEVAHLLGEAFGQTLGEDEMPVLGGSPVYYGYLTCEEGESPAYTNDARATENPGHGGGTATCTEPAVCPKCGEIYGEVDANAHAFDITTGKCGRCGADMTVIATVTDGTRTYYAEDTAMLNQAVTLILKDGSRAFTVNLPADAPAALFTAIRRAICDTEGVADGSVDLTLAGVTAIPDHSEYAAEGSVIFGKISRDENSVALDEEVHELNSVSLPDAVTIGAHTFYYCEKLTCVTAPKVQTIGKYAFEDTGLTSVELPEVTTIDSCAFLACNSLTSAKLPSATNISSLAFSGSTRIAYLELTAPGDIFVHENGLGYPTTYSGSIDLVLNLDKAGAVTDGVTWNGFTFKSIAFICADGTTNHSCFWSDNGDGTHDQACDKCSYVAVDNEYHNYDPTTGKCDICGVQIVAAVGGSYFSSFADAAAAVSAENSTVTVFTDVTIGAEETIAFAAVATLDVAEGKTITCDGTVTIGDKEGIIFDNQLYYHGGDITWTGLDLEHVGTGPTYYTAGEGYALWLGEGLLELYGVTISSEIPVDYNPSSVLQYFHRIRFYGENSLTGSIEGLRFESGDGPRPLALEAGETNAVLSIYAGISCGTLTVESGTVNVTGIDVLDKNGVSYAIDAESLTVKEGAVVNASSGSAGFESFAVMTTEFLLVDGTLNAVTGAAPQFADVLAVGGLTVGENGKLNALVQLISYTEQAAQMEYTVYGEAALTEDLTVYNPYAGMEGEEGEEEIAVTLTFTVLRDATLTVNAGVTLDLSALAMEDIDFSGTVINNGTIILPDTYIYNTIPENLNGTVAIGEKTYTWNGEKWICGEGSHTFEKEENKATCARGMVCDICGESYGEVDLSNHDEKAEYENGFCVNCDAYEPAVLNAEGVYEIGNAGQLYWFADKVNHDNANYGSANAILSADIVVNGNVLKGDGTLNGDGSGFRPWTPIGNKDMRYTGTFDGQNHTVSGLYFNDSAADYVGLFGSVGEDGTVQNVGVLDSYLSGSNSIGGVVGSNSGTITNCYNTGTVNGSRDAGGVAGSNGGTIQDCYNTGTVSGSSSVGGVVGNVYPGTIQDCYNTGTVSGSRNVGGVAGYISNGGTIQDCYNTGTVSGGDRHVGGVVGYMGGYTGSGSTVRSCYNTGAVSGSGDYVGGVAGVIHEGTVTNCYNTGTVSSSGAYVGGMVGSIKPGSTVSNCYNTGAVSSSGSSSVGGVSGDSILDTGATLTNNYYLQAGSAGSGAARNAAQFASGEVAYLLQGDQTEQIWGQQIGTDTSPTLGGPKVYYGYTSCGDSKMVYTNDANISAEKPGHTGTLSYKDNGDGKHTGTYSCCGTEITERHTGGIATCKDQAKCNKCGASYGEFLSHQMDPTTGLCKYGCGELMAQASTTVGGTTYYETLNEAIQAVKGCNAADSATVTLLKNVDVESNPICSGVFTLDLNGKTLTGTTYGLSIFASNVTITDSGTGGSISGSIYGVIVEEGGDVTINGGTISGGTSGVYADNSTATITGGTISGNSGVYADNSTATITGGTISGFAGVEAKGGNVTISGGSISDSSYGVWSGDSTVSISGGTINGDVSDLILIGTSDVLTLSEGATFPGGLTVEGTTLKAILGDGLAYWQDGRQIVLKEGQTEITDGTVTVMTACDHSTGTASYAPTEDGTQHIVSWSCCGAEITEDHTGGIATCKDQAKCSKCGASYGEFLSHQMDFSTGLCGYGCGTQLAVASVTMPYVGGIAVVDTTTYYETLDEAVQAVQNCTAADNATVTLLKEVDVGKQQNITDGTFTIDLNSKTLTGTTYGLYITGGDVTITDTGTGGVIIGSTGVYVTSGGTVTINDGNISGTGTGVSANNSTVTIEGGTVSGTGTGVYANSSDVTINDGNISDTNTGVSAYNSTVTINDGNISNTSTGVSANNSTVTIEGGTVSGRTGVHAYGSTVTISDSDISSTSAGVYANDSDVTINDGNISGTSYGMDVNGGTVNINDSDISGTSYGMDVNGGTVNISGGTVSGTNYDLYLYDGTVTLTLAEGKTEGVTFPGGLKVRGTTLKAILGEGLAYWQDGKQVSITDSQTEITGGDVTVKKACDHSTGTASYAPTEDGTQHIVSWSCCGAEITQRHTGGTATCEAKAKCSKCSAEYGELAAHVMDPATGKCGNGCEKLMAEASATVGGTTTYYETLDEAIQAVKDCNAEDNATVQLLESLTLPYCVIIDSGVFTLDLNSKTLTSVDSVLQVGGSADVTVRKGTITCTNISNAAVYTEGGTLTFEECSIIGVVAGVDMYGGAVTIRNCTVTGENEYGVIVEEGTATIENSTIESKNMGVVVMNGIATISGGSVTGGSYDLYGYTIVLTLNAEGKGTTFPGGLTVENNTLKAILGDGLAYWQDNQRVSITDSQTEITGGDVTVRATCDHSGNTNNNYTSNGNNTHSLNCSVCGAVAKTQNCSGGEATCIEQAKCEFCGADYGELLSHTYTYTVDDDNDVITERCIAGCGHVATATISTTDKTYDGTAVEASVSCSDNWTGGDLEITYAVKDGATLDGAPVNAGSYTASVTIDGATASVDFSIDKADVIIDTTPAPNKLTYNGDLQELVNGGTATGGKMVYSLTEDGQFSERIPTGTDAGDYTVWYYVDGDENHSDSEKASVKVTIAKATLTVKANDHTITYGEAPNNVGVTYTGFVPGDVESSLSGSLTYTYSYERYEDVGSYTITPAGLTSGNYEITFVNGTLTVDAKDVQILDTKIQDVTYNADGYQLVVTEVTFSGVVEGENLAYTATAELKGTNAVGTQGTEVTVTLNNSNYTLATATYQTTVTISKANQADLMITGQKDSPAYGDSFALGTSGGTTNGAVTWAATGTASVDESGKVTIAGVGSFTITATMAGGVNYKDVTATWTGTSVKADPDIGKVTHDGETLYDSTAVSDVVLTRTNMTVAGVLNLTDSQLTAGEGTYHWTFTPVDTENYNIITGTVTLNVTANVLETIEVSGTLEKDSYSYGDTFSIDGLTVTATYTGGATKDVTELVNFDSTLAVGQTSVELTYQGKTCEVTGITVTKKQLDVSHMAWNVPTNAVYSESAYTATLTGELPEGVKVDVSGNTGTNAGSYTAKAVFSLADGYSADNYEIVNGEDLTAAWSIAKKDIAGAEVVLGDTLTYNGEEQTQTVTKVEIDGLTVTYTVSGNTGTDAKGYTLTVTGNGNFEGTATAEWSIAKKNITGATITLGGSLSYNGEQQAQEVTEVEVDGLTVTYDVTANKQTNAGSYTLTVTGNGNFEGSATADWSIAKAKLTITANDNSITYGDVPVANGVTGTGFVSSEIIEDLSGELAYSYNYEQFGNVGTYKITPAGLTSDNYEITFVAGTLTVNAKTITVTADAVSKTYGDTDPTLTYEVIGLVNGDELSGALSREAGTDVGTYAITQGTMTAGSNYTIAFHGADLTINAKAITEADVKLNGSLTYTGEQQTQEVTVTDGITYEVSGNKATYVGSYELTVTGTGNYTGEVKLSWSIKEASAVVGTAPAANDLTYSGKDQALVNTGATSDGKLVYSLTENGEYTETIPTGNAAGDYTVWYYVVGDENHADSAKAFAKVTIAKAKAEISVNTDPITVTYGETVILPTATTNFGIVACDKTASDLVNAGTYTVTYTVAGTDNYDGDTKTVTVIVGQKAVAEPTVSGTYTYTGDEQTVTLSGVESYMTVASGNKGTNAGSYEAVITLDANHKWADGSDGRLTWSIGKAKAEISVNTDPITVTYGETVILPTATTNFGTVVCDKTASDLVNAGTYTVTYTVAGTDNYDGDTKTVTVIVGQKAVAEPTVTGTYTYTGDEQTVTLSGVESYMTVASGNKGTNAGSYEVEITLDGNHKWADGSDGKFRWSIGKARSEISVNTDPITVTYGETVILPTATTNFGIVACDKTASDLVNAGTYTVTYIVAGTDNYDGDTKSITVTVNAKAITKADVELNGSLAYTGEEQIQLITVTEGITYEISGNKATNVGTYELTVKGTGNYTGEVKLTWSIKEAAAVVAKAPVAKTLTYTGEAQALITAGEAKGGTMQYQLNGGAWSVSIPTATDEGSYTVSYKVVGDANHADSEVKTLTVTIGDCTHSGNIHVDDADCTTEVNCSVCGDVLTEAKTHVWGDWTTTKEPTTTEEGSKERPCANDGCEAKDTDSIPMLNEVEAPKPEGGDIEISNPTPATGEDVTITVTPDTGKEVDKVTVKDETGKEIPVTDNGDGTYTYEQPDGDVTVEVVIKDTIYTVTWIVDGTIYKTTQHKYGETITAPADPIKAQSGCTTYTFDKWSGFTSGMTMPDNESLTFTAVFTEGESHIDDNTDHICDRNCGKTDMGDHVDENLDHVCDYGCTTAIGEHKDTNKDHACDYGCTEFIGTCEDADKDHACDYGCDKVYGTHEDTDKNHACDYGCKVAIGTCDDADKDHACDYGCDKVYGEHEDTDKDHDCDYGCKVAIGTCEDDDKDHNCDYGCDKVYGKHEDNNADHICDYGCKVTIGTHEDTNKDHICDYGCSETIGTCEDADKDHNCDYGCDKVYGEHEDTDKNHVCDYGCKVAIGTCEDADKDHACDYGCDKVYGEHADSNKDHICDYGCNVAIGTCSDADKDHACDYGCDKVYGTHEDTNKDHVCDYGCSETIGTCEDADKDHDCDYGCDKVYGEHKDPDKDHVCDYGCTETIGTCEDADKDHDCDYGCDKVYGTHEDTDKNHACDYGCSETIGTCEDADKDHACDYGCDKVYGKHEDNNADHICDYGCKVTIGTHEDTNKDHICDYGCSETIGTCEDADKDHDCDYGCDKVYGEHKDTNKDHVCDYGCTETIGTCEDADKDHDCDYGCDKVYSEHKDTDKDHACDYGCSETIGTCDDADKDHACDYGCDKVYGEHKDTDKDHVCDYGCKVAIGTCEDADKDHDCDYGCDKVYGEHEDTDKDHACDYGCSETIGTCDDADKDHDCDYGCDQVYGEHKDTAGDGDHVCDYGCGETLTDCADVDTDTDHKCDECGAAMPKDGTQVEIPTDNTGTITPGAPAEIDGKPIVIDWDGEIWLEDKGSKLLVTYKFNEDADPHKEYPTAMYAWLLKWEGDTCKAIRVPELDNFMTYKGTSIRINHSSDGIRFFTAVPVDTLNQAMNGSLLTGELEGYKLVELGTLYKWAATGTELTVANGAKSYVYGGSAGSTYRQFSEEGSLSWFTGMLTDLPGDAATLAKDILSRPYAVFENADGDQITLYGGSIQRSIYYVAQQNKDTWASGTAYDDYVEKIISTVEAAKG